jgi:hypothetical protein
MSRHRSCAVSAGWSNMRSRGEAGRDEDEMNRPCFAAGDHLERIRAFQEGRDATFKR